MQALRTSPTVHVDLAATRCRLDILLAQAFLDDATGNELKRARLQADYRDEFGSNVAKAAQRALDLATQIVGATTR